MKTAVLIAAVFALLSTQAQTTFSPATPVSSPSPVTSPPAPVMVPGGPAMAIDLVNSSSLANAETVNPDYTVPGLSALLTNLENAVIQVLPVVTAFNDGFNSFVLDSTGVTTGVGSTGDTGLVLPPPVAEAPAAPPPPSLT
ncbi:MAG TPA: hypothetical protein VNT26_01960, partial [Candidatus Sulfotelmatobacter sp.]|nr:hypothetical protein [Candidatus Sulfotelmatobacter sp.]